MSLPQHKAGRGEHCETCEHFSALVSPGLNRKAKYLYINRQSQINLNSPTFSPRLFAIIFLHLDRSG